MGKIKPSEPLSRDLIDEFFIEDTIRKGRSIEKEIKQLNGKNKNTTKGVAIAAPEKRGK